MRITEKIKLQPISNIRFIPKVFSFKGHALSRVFQSDHIGSPLGTTSDVSGSSLCAFLKSSAVFYYLY